MTQNNGKKKADNTPRLLGKFISVACFGTCFLTSSCTSVKSIKSTGSTLAGDTVVKYLTGANNYYGTSLASSWPEIYSSSPYSLNSGLVRPPNSNSHTTPYARSYGTRYSVSNEVIDGPAERIRMRKLCNKFHKYPRKREKYTILLNKEYDKLIQRRETRISRKLDFLKELYTSLSNGDFNKFNRTCRRHCTNMMLRELKNISEDEENGIQLWYQFCNPEKQLPNKIQICHIKYSDYSVPGLKQFYPIIYGDSSKWKYDRVPYCDADARWYLVTLDKDPIFVRLEGTGSFILITGIINPAMQLVYRDLPDSFHILKGPDSFHISVSH